MNTFTIHTLPKVYLKPQAQYLIKTRVFIKDVPDLLVGNCLSGQMLEGGWFGWYMNRHFIVYRPVKELEMVLCYQSIVIRLLGSRSSVMVVFQMLVLVVLMEMGGDKVVQMLVHWIP